MIWLMKLCVFAQVALGIQQRDVYASNITWEPMQIPLVFGKDVGIRCSYHNTLSCNDPIIWTWYTGTDNDLIMTNGTLSEEFKHQHKYSEITSSCLQVSTLIVSNFNESDYNQTYKCGIAIIKQSGRSFAENIKDKITFENTSYEYVPSDEMISTEIKLLANQNISFRAEIERVYPLPDCEATFKDEDITTSLKIQKKKKSIFYHVYISLTLNHTSVEYVRTICIKCKGTESWWYLTKSWNPYCTDKPTTDDSDKFEIRMKKLNIIDIFHCVWASGILFGYSETIWTDNRDIFRQHVQYGYVFIIIERIGEIKFISFFVVMFIVAMTSIKTIKKKVFKNDLAEYLILVLSMVVNTLLVLLFDKDGKDGSKETASAWYNLNTVQLFIPARSYCCFMLRRLHNTEDTEDKVGDKKREKDAFLMDNGYDDKSFSSSGEKKLLMDTELDLKSFERSGTNVLMVDIENDGKSVGNSETQTLLVEKDYDAEPFGSSESYNTTNESPNDEEMCSAETAF